METCLHVVGDVPYSYVSSEITIIVIDVRYLVLCCVCLKFDDK